MNKRHIAVFSGGSAANTLVDVYGKLAVDKGCSLSYIIPISDNGGSSSELIRVFGGPGIGDVRSRLVRLIPTIPVSPESAALSKLFNHRLSSNPSAARLEWLDLIELRHDLWGQISSSKRELIRSFLNAVNFEIVKRIRPTSSFTFQSAAVGNLFLTGARIFTGSFESAIYLLSAITGVPSDIDVIPAINSNFSHHISAGLEDGTVITGQNSISHPSAPAPLLPNHSSASSQILEDDKIMNPTTREFSEYDTIEDANLPGSLPTLRKQYISFAKTHTQDLPSRIERIWYINPYGQEISPAPNTNALSSIEMASVVIYSIGSLYTSLIPCLILRGVGARIKDSGAKYKVLILNGSLDRETRFNGTDFTAKDFVRALVDACAGRGAAEKTWKDYITHLLYLVGEGAPVVEKDELSRLGVECVRVCGQKNDGEDKGMIYDGSALGQALSAIVGLGRGGVSRRNTLGVGK